MSNMFWAFNECLLIASIHRSSVLNVITCCFICGRIIQHKRFTFFQVKSWVSLREDSQRPRHPTLHPRQCWALAVTIRVVLLTDTRAEVPGGGAEVQGAPSQGLPGWQHLLLSSLTPSSLWARSGQREPVTAGQEEVGGKWKHTQWRKTAKG